MSDNLQTADPMEFVAGLLDTLPAEPGDASMTDLGRLAAGAEGLYRHLAALRAVMAGLALRTLDADADDEDAHEEMREERARLEVLGWRGDAAHDRLTDYAGAALAAHGFTIADLTAGDDLKE